MGFLEELPVAGIVGRKDFFEAFSVCFDERGKTITLDHREDAPNVIPWKDVPIYKPPLPRHKRSRGQNR